eukprot:3523898-Ditylum_brightwellii.AAC.1
MGNDHISIVITHVTPSTSFCQRKINDAANDYASDTPSDTVSLLNDPTGPVQLSSLSLVDLFGANL